MKGLVAVELRDAALVKMVSNPSSGFAPGDVVSVGGRLDFDVDTLQNVAIASPEAVSRILRAAPSKLARTRAPAASLAGSGFFGGGHKPAADRVRAQADSAPPVPDFFPIYTPFDAEHIGLSDIAP